MLRRDTNDDACTCEWGVDNPTTTLDECSQHSTQRCLCGHYRREHPSGGRCHGAYGTLAVDADDTESVEVYCPCDNYWQVEDGYHTVRSNS